MGIQESLGAGHVMFFGKWLVLEKIWMTNSSLWHLGFHFFSFLSQNNSYNTLQSKILYNLLQKWNTERRSVTN